MYYLDFYFEEYQQELINAELIRLRNENEKLKNLLRIKNEKSKISLDQLKGYNWKVTYLTGISNYETLNILFDDAMHYIPIVINGKMSKFDVFLMTLMKIRLDLPFTFLGLQYSLSCSTISNLFYETILVLYMRFKCFIHWPDCTAWKLNTPDVFKEVFGENKVVIIDCFEIFCERPGKAIFCEIFKKFNFFPLR